MKPPFLNLSTPNRSPIAFSALRGTNLPSKYDCGPNFVTESPNPQFTKRFHLITLCSSSNCPNTTTQLPIAGRSNPRANSISGANERGNQWKSEIRNPILSPVVSNWRSSFRLRENTFLLLAFMASMTSMAFISLVAAAVPTLYAIRRAAVSFAELVDMAKLELPNTMAAIRLSSMEISDLTLELNDLKQDISERVPKSAQAVEESEAGNQIGAMSCHQSISMVHERAKVLGISSQPVVFGARKRTFCAIAKATSAPTNISSREGLTL